MYVPVETDLKLLAILADGKSHPWFEVVFLGVQYLKIRQDEFEYLLYRAVIMNNWMSRSGHAPDLKSDSLQLTERGDRYYRSICIRRAGDPRYYKYFSRELESSGYSEFGLDKYAPLPKNLQRID